MRKKTAIRAALLSLLALALLAAVYVVYVFASWRRLPDNLPLEVASAVQTGGVEVGKPYCVVTYNVGFGAYSADYSFFMDGGRESRARSTEAVEENITGAMAVAADLNPDFLLLQEVDVDSTRSCHVDELALTRQLAGESYCSTFAQNYDSPYLFWPLTAPHGANRAGQVTFSHYPIVSALRRSLPVEEGVMKVVDLDRCYSVSRIPVTAPADSSGRGEARELVLYNLHLSAYTSDGTIAEEQLRILFADMLAEYQRGSYIIAGGDFNKDLLGNSDEIFGVSGEDYMWAQPIPPEMVPQGLTIVAPLNSGTPVPSCRNADRPYGPDSYVVTVDGFIVSDNVSVTGAWVQDTGFQWSDHNPAVLNMTLMP